MKITPRVVLSKVWDYDDVYDSESSMSWYYVITEYTDTEKYQYRYTNVEDMLEHLDRYKRKLSSKEIDSLQYFVGS